MKNNNIRNSVIYAIIGAILGIATSLSATMTIEYVGGVLRKPLVQEFSMVFFAFATPISFLLGLILGIIYSRKYKNL